MTQSFLRLAAAGAVLFSCLLPAGAQSPYALTGDSQPQPNVPQGKSFQFDLVGKKTYPGTKSTIFVYVPAEYTPSHRACLCVGLDGPNYSPQTVFDNLIAKKQMPVTIGVFVTSGTVNKPGTDQPLRFDRCYEFDSTNGNFDRFLSEEVLPAVLQHKTPDGAVIRLSADPNDRMIYGGSSGGVCAWTAAWERPDMFRRVFTAIGTYVGMRGADMYPTLIRKTEPKPIRIFQQDGSQDTWNPLFDNWYTQNRSMEESLGFAGYDHDHNWGTLGHEGSHAASIFPDVVRWLWRDYPKPIEAGWSGNSMLQSVLVRGQGWQRIPGNVVQPAHLTASPSGDVAYVQAGTTINKIGSGGQSQFLAHAPAPVTALSSGPDSRLYVATANGQIATLGLDGKWTPFARGIAASGMYVGSDSSVYVSEAGRTDSVPSKLWRIASSGKKTLLDSGLHDASGVMLSPDHNLLFAAEAHTHWIYSYVLAADGTLIHKQPFYWLHVSESEDNAGDFSDATDIADDSQGDLYVATRMGVQICDRNGRVEGILTLPSGQVTSLTFGGPKFDHLYVISGEQIYSRPLHVPGVPNFAPAIPLPPFGAG